jgi:hypothetical protein
MAAKNENQLVQKIEKFIREHKEYKKALETIAKQMHNGPAKSYAKEVLRNVRAR